MPDDKALESAVAYAARTLPADQLAQLARELERVDGPTPSVRSRACSLVATDVFGDAVGSIFDAWSAAGTVSGSGIALALTAAANATEHERGDERVEIVWSGPTTTAIGLRRTRAVLFELIRAAANQLTLVSYAAYRQDDLVKELNEAAVRGVRVRLVLESTAGSRGRLDEDAARAFENLEGFVEILEWPAELRGEGRTAGVLHAKLAVADSRQALVSSANLTAAALDRNIELGLLVTGGDIPRRLEQHFTELRVKRILRLVEPL